MKEAGQIQDLYHYALAISPDLEEDRGLESVFWYGQLEEDMRRQRPDFARSLRAAGFKGRSYKVLAASAADELEKLAEEMGIDPYTGRPPADW